LVIIPRPKFAVCGNFEVWRKVAGAGGSRQKQRSTSAIARERKRQKHRPIGRLVTPVFCRIQPHHAPKLRRLLGRLDVAKGAEDMNLPGWRLHNLAGDPAGFQSVTVNGNWRSIFTFQDGDAVLVD
jgi:proteic killer suppression protein